MTSSAGNDSPLAPQPLHWQISIALQAMFFFSFEGHKQGLEVLGRVDPAGTFVPFEGVHFMEYLNHVGFTEIWPRIRQVASVIDGLVREAHLSRLDGAITAPGLPGRFVTMTPSTALQRGGDLWLAPVLGPMLLIPRIGGATVPLSGVSAATGNPTIGSGIALDGEHILTAAHVVNDMEIDDDLMRPAVDSSVDAHPHPSGELHVEAVKAHPKVDVAIVRVSGMNGAAMDAADGLAWRDPKWSDELTIFGYPSVPTSLGCYLTVQRGEVVNPLIETGRGDAFLYSAIARPGNSGGPIVGRDGRLLGIVTHEPNAPSSTHSVDDGDAVASHGDERTGAPVSLPLRQREAPFYAGVSSTIIARALDDLGFGHLARLETWQ